MMTAIVKVNARQLHCLTRRIWGYGPISSSLSTSSTTNCPKTKRKTELDFEELEELMQTKNVSLIDVRHPCELQSCGEIPGSVHIPLNCLKNALQMPDKDWNVLFRNNKPNKFDKNLVFYARGPNSSSAAVEIAHRLGFKGSRHYSGGWEDYCDKAGIPIKKIELLEDVQEQDADPFSSNSKASLPFGDDFHLASN